MQPFKHITSAAVTDIGRKRQNNEDAFAVIPEHGFFCVADGMGGEEDGEIASGAITDGFKKLFERFDPARPLSLAAKTAWVTRMIDEVSNWIFQHSHQRRGKPGTGTTFVGVAFDPASPDRALALHAGDSRVYHWRHGLRADSDVVSGRKNTCSVMTDGGRLTPVTIDHSVANLMGKHDERRLNPWMRNMIMRAVGLAPSVQVELTPFGITAGDWVLVCSDGLSKMVPDSEIAAIFSSSSDPEVTARSFVDAALAAGGKDNVTVVVIRVGDLPDPLSEEGLDQTLPPATEETADEELFSETTPSTQDTPRVKTEPWVPVSRNLLFWAVVIVASAVVLGVVTYEIAARLTGASVHPPPEKTMTELQHKAKPSGQRKIGNEKKVRLSTTS